MRKHKMIKNLDRLKRYWVYWDGYRVVQVRSVGYKWCWIRSGPFSGPYQRKFSKVKRSVWDKMMISTMEELQDKVDIQNRAAALGISNIVKCKKVKSHPTKKFGWRYRTFEEISDMVFEADVLPRRYG
jgi:hypothetical protein|tara:strand:+ start:392 stop:775 length:384 start_codon:yes stop_codon:yes gene_type:complete